MPPKIAAPTVTTAAAAPSSDGGKSAILASMWPIPPPEQYADTGICLHTSRPIRICYNTFGRPTDPCMLLIMGLGCQGLYWDSRFCTMLAEAGFYVIRYDNRDVGLSTHLDDITTPLFLWLALPRWLSMFEGKLPYSIGDMADDAARLLRTIGIQQAHVVGCSMGGMIAQSLIIRHPQLVCSLCLLSTSSGVPIPQPLALLGTLVRPRDSKPETVLAYKVNNFRAISGRLPFPTEEFTAGMSYAVQRSTYEGGHWRQMAAIARSPDRSAGLRRLNAGYDARRTPGMRGPITLVQDALAWMGSKLWPAAAKRRAEEAAERARAPFVPAVVLHGGSDPIIPVSNGVRLASLIPGSKLVVFPDFGHYFPPSLFRPLADQVILNAREGETTRRMA